MPDTFVPLMAMSISPVSSPQQKVLPQAEAKLAFEPMPAAGRAETTARTCASPSVTLQRQGEVVSGIRIECGCGQIIELACAY